MDKNPRSAGDAELIEVQKSSYDLFLRPADAETRQTGCDGIQGVFSVRFFPDQGLQ